MALDPESRRTLFDESQPEPKEAWHVEELAVSPACQGQGIGRLLLDWGKAMARKENVPVLLEGTLTALSFYEKCGFRGYGNWQWGKTEGDVYRLMRWDPETNDR
jgi:GNAT superfamily N-acetyltransferase